MTQEVLDAAGISEYNRQKNPGVGQARLALGASRTASLFSRLRCPGVRGRGRARGPGAVLGKPWPFGKPLSKQTDHTPGRCRTPKASGHSNPSPAEP